MAATRDPIRVLITGASGFAGSHLVACLLANAGDRAVDLTLTVHAASGPVSIPDLDCFPSAVDPAAVHITELNITDEQAVRELLALTQPQQIYHLAAAASGAGTDRAAIFQVNLEGSRNLLDAAKSLTSLPKVLLISTGYVYGSVAPGYRACESDPLAQPGRFGPYTDSKIAMEELAGSYPNSVVIRAFAHTGPGQSESFAIPAFAAQIARIEAGLLPPVIRVGNLAAVRDICDVRDVVDAYRLAMERAPSGRTYNVCSGFAAPMSDILARLVAASTVPMQVEPDPARMRPADIARSAGDSSLIESELGWQRRYSLNETLIDTLNYWRGRIASSAAQLERTGS